MRSLRKGNRKERPRLPQGRHESFGQPKWQRQGRGQARRARKGRRTLRRPTYGGSPAKPASVGEVPPIRLRSGRQPLNRLRSGRQPLNRLRSGRHRQNGFGRAGGWNRLRSGKPPNWLRSGRLPERLRPGRCRIGFGRPDRKAPRGRRFGGAHSGSSRVRPPVSVGSARKLAGHRGSHPSCKRLVIGYVSSQVM